jgi:hypothetical protein
MAALKRLGEPAGDGTLATIPFAAGSGMCARTHCRFGSRLTQGMAMVPDDARIQQMTDEFVEELYQAIRGAAYELIEAALLGDRTALGMGGRRGRRGRRGASAPAAGGARVANARRPKGAKRSTEELEQLKSTLIGYVKKNPGQRIEQIGEALGVPTRELVLPMRKLIGEKAVKAKGHKRSTTYAAS